MAIFVPEHFAAHNQLKDQGLAIFSGGKPGALRIGLLNLMPEKKTTERQFARIFGQTGNDVQLVPLRMKTHAAKHCEQGYLDRVYGYPTAQVLASLDRLVVTGAPVERMEFADVDYWPEFTRMLDRLGRTRLATLFICWSAQAALFHNHGITKHMLTQKASGVFPQWLVDNSSPLVRGFGDRLITPVSRHTSIHALDILARPVLDLIAGSDVTGPGLVCDRRARQTFMFNHFEYEPGTLHAEFLRDNRRDASAVRPQNYYENGVPVDRWSRQAKQFFHNWLSDVADSRSPAGTKTMDIAA